MRVLIVLPGAIGDVVRGLPLLGRLRRAWPEAYLAWAVEPPSAPLLADHSWLDAMIAIDRRTPTGFVGTLRRVHAGGFDLAIDLGRGIRSGLLLAASRAPERLGFHRRDGREGSWLFATRRLPPQGVARAKLDQFLAFGDLLGLPEAPVEFGLAPTAAEAATAARLLDGLPRPLVGASLGSSCASRRWFPRETAVVLDGLAGERGATPVLLGTAADAGFATEVRASLAATPCDLVGRTTLRELMAVLAHLDVVLGPDSGALHLAGALGVPVVSLWGATSAARSVPWGAAAWAVEGEAPCRPCFLSRCPIGRVCMRAIGPAVVLERAREALAA